MKMKPAETELQPSAPGKVLCDGLSRCVPTNCIWILALPLAGVSPWANYLVALGLRVFLSHMEILRASASVGCYRYE